MQPYFNKMTVIGTGLIGGSLAMVLRSKGLVGRITGTGRGIANLEAAVRLGVIDNFTTDAVSGVMDADLVVIATPVVSICGILQQIAPYLKEGTIVTDVGSVKGEIVRAAGKSMHPGRYFVGGHPIAGTEESGVEAAFPDLFRGSRCILTPVPSTDKKALETVKTLWEAAGCEVILMDTVKHDKILAAVSHLPHMIAYSMVNTVDGINDFQESVINYSAGGFRDFSRIASSSPDMWRDICIMNREAIVDMIGRFETTLRHLKHSIEISDSEAIVKEFIRSKKVRETIIKKDAKVCT